MKMNTDEKALYDILCGIYQTHRRIYSENSYDSRQMCLMWSTNDPPGIIEAGNSFKIARGSVIPEPNTMGILLLAGLVTIIRRLRMRKG
jgi:hypothetical protein